MKKEILTHSMYLVIFSVLAIILKGYIAITWDAAYIIGLFLLGGIAGTILPDIDHIIYIYFLRPYELTSQRVNYLISKQEIVATFELLAATRSERKKLIFHTAHFQLLFWILAFLVISSSGSFFGRGLVLAFALHLLVDQLIDLMTVDNLDTWFRSWGLILGKEKYMFYWIANLIVLLIFGFVM